MQSWSSRMHDGMHAKEVKVNFLIHISCSRALVANTTICLGVGSEHSLHPTLILPTTLQLCSACCKSSLLNFIPSHRGSLFQREPSVYTTTAVLAATASNFGFIFGSGHRSLLREMEPKERHHITSLKGIKGKWHYERSLRSRALD
jgi:hypothetical protein